MPIYEYRCTSCHRTIEVIQKVGDAPPECCSYCSGPLEKLISRTSFHLKGGGWFNSDYGAGKAGAKDEGAKATETAPSEGAGTKKADTSSDGDSPKTGGGCASGSCGCSN
jgi:putative FmdB family regulatory protein